MFVLSHEDEPGNLFFSFLGKATWYSEVQRITPKYWIIYLNKNITVILYKSSRVNIGSAYYGINTDLSNAIREYKTCSKIDSITLIIISKICFAESDILSYSTYQTYTISSHLTLAFNLTFLQFHLSSAIQCLPGKQDYLVEYVRIIECNQTPNDTSNILQYCNVTRMCGVYPAHSYYLIRKTTYLQISLTSKYDSRVVMFFEIMDAGLVSYYNITTAYNIAKHYNANRLFHRISFCHIQLLGSQQFQYNIFRIITKHIFKLVLYSNDTNLVIFNGPDTGYPILKGSKYNKQILFKADTYQAMILIYDNTSIVSLHFDKMLSYYSVHTWNIEDKGLQKVMFPWQECTNKFFTFCIIKIDFPANKQYVRFQISHMLYSGPSMLGDMCSYGLLSVYSKNQSGYYNKILLLCDSTTRTGGFNNGSSIEQPYFYTDGYTEELWISTTSYALHSKISVIFKFSLTNCKGFFYPLLNVDETDQYHVSLVVRKSKQFSCMNRKCRVVSVSELL